LSAMASVLEGDVNRALSTLEKLVSGEAAPLPKPLPRLRDLDKIVTRVLAPRSASALPGCRPWDYGDFLSRAQSFKATLWFAKPDALSPLRCARFGWRCQGRDTLVCTVCGATVTMKEPYDESLEQLLAESHRSICPWKEDPSPLSFLDFQYLSDADCLRQIQARLAAFAARPEAKLEEAHVVVQPESLVKMVSESVAAEEQAEERALRGEQSPSADVSIDDMLAADDADAETSSVLGGQKVPSAAPSVAPTYDEVMAIFYGRMRQCTGMPGGDAASQAAAVFALYGWTASAEAGNQSTGSSPGKDVLQVLECKFCGAVVRVRATAAGANPGEPRPAKRKRPIRFHPERSHRIWCPLVSAGAI